jgi:hypothetical protein
VPPRLASKVEAQERKKKLEDFLCCSLLCTLSNAINHNFSYFSLSLSLPIPIPIQMPVWHSFFALREKYHLNLVCVSDSIFLFDSHIHTHSIRKIVFHTEQSQASEEGREGIPKRYDLQREKYC